MSGSFSAPIFRALDAAGNPIGAATLTFYATGTTTLQSVYTTASLTIALPNPVVADAGGLFPNIFLDESKTYRVILKTGSGTTIADADPVNSLSSAGVQFLQLGTGAIIRTAQSKLRELAYSPEDFGAAGDNGPDDRAALQACIDALALQGGGQILLSRSATYRCVINTSVPDLGLIVKDDVEIIGNGATINLECTGAVYGVRLKNHSKIRDCTVVVAVSASPGSQGIWHSPISIGAAYGEGGTVGAVSTFQTITDWAICNVVVSSARSDGWIGIVGYGDISRGIVNGVTIGDSSTCFGGVHFDWGFVGIINSSDVPTSRANFDAATAYTTHPHDIEVPVYPLDAGASFLSRSRHAASLTHRVVTPPH